MLQQDILVSEQLYSPEIRAHHTPSHRSASKDSSCRAMTKSQNLCYSSSVCRIAASTCPPPAELIPRAVIHSACLFGLDWNKRSLWYRFRRGARRVDHGISVSGRGPWLSMILGENIGKQAGSQTRACRAVPPGRHPQGRGASEGRR